MKFELVDLDGPLVELSNEGVLVAFQVVYFEILFSEVCSKRIDFVFELADGAEGKVMPIFEVCVGVGLRKGLVYFFF